MPVPGANYSYDYEKIVSEINQLRTGDEKKLLHFMRYWCEEDLFFLLYFILRVPVNHPFLVDRVKEVQECNDQTLDLWAREFFKSTIITYGLNIQCILRDPNERIGIFSHTRSIAKAFLRRIKLTFESNDLLKALFPDILYQNPTSQSPKWSEDDGILINRPTIFQESTVEAWGLTDGQPVSKHFSILNYDDIVTIDSVRTSDQLKKTDDCFKMSDNLGADGGVKRVIGTIYHFNDQHIKLIEQGGWHVRKHPAENADGTPTFLPEEKLAKKRRDLGPYVYSTQMLLNPIAKKDQRFRYEWLKWYRTLPSNLSLYLLCDPANEKKCRITGGDYTVFWLWGLDSNGNKFLVDVVRDRLTLSGRWKALKKLMIKYPRIQRVGYEQYGMTADVQHFEEMMATEGFYFNILSLGGNKLTKEDRIARLIPAFEQGYVYLPEHLEYEDKEGNIIDLVKVFVDEEYLRFPFSQHDDMLDAASRIEDKVLDVTKPFNDGYDEEVVQHDIAGFFNQIRRGDDDGGRDYITGY
jgi:predicted phage terminase large subunit-like protein